MLNENQTKVERLIYKGYSVFITGKGCSGKSYFLRSIIEKLRARGDRCFVTAPTGKAANKGEFRSRPISAFVYILVLSQSECVNREFCKHT